MIIDDLFEVGYGTNLELNRLQKTKNGINFVSRIAKNNGVSAIVKPIDGLNPIDGGLISVAGGGNALSTFLQNKPFYSGRDVFYLKPRKSMTIQEKLFYCMCIRANQFKYSFYRQANKTLKNIKLPDKLPDWVKNQDIQTQDIAKPVLEKKINITDRKWEPFQYDSLFEIKKGKRLVISQLSKKDRRGTCPYISSTAKNNGVSSRINVKPNHRKNTISINYDGSVGETYYQPKDFWASDSVNVLYPKFNLNPYIAMFLIPLIKKERYRFNYYRKWGSDKMEETIISLPVDKNGSPDWQFMEDYIKSLPYSSNLEN